MKKPEIEAIFFEAGGTLFCPYPSVGEIYAGTAARYGANFDPEVLDRAVKASRFVIAGFDEEDWEAVAYKNALRVFGQGVVANPDIKVIDTRSWPECTSSQMNGCDDSCDMPEGDSLTPEQENCFQACVIGKQCREVVEMDVG